MAVILAAGQPRLLERFKPLLPLGEGCTIGRVVQTILNAASSDILFATGNCALESQQVLVSPADCLFCNVARQKYDAFSSIHPDTVLAPGFHGKQGLIGKT